MRSEVWIAAIGALVVPILLAVIYLPAIIEKDSCLNLGGRWDASIQQCNPAPDEWGIWRADCSGYGGTWDERTWTCVPPEDVAWPPVSRQFPQGPDTPRPSNGRMLTAEQE